jgi:hypothetical protein
MNGSEAEPASRDRFTRFAELDAVLDVLVHGIRELLGGNFVGACLQGSFAIGDADTGSDCDFIVAIGHDLTSGEIGELDELHGAIHRLPYLPLATPPRRLLRAARGPSAMDARSARAAWGSSASTGLAR